MKLTPKEFIEECDKLGGLFQGFESGLCINDIDISYLLEKNEECLNYLLCRWIDSAHIFYISFKRSADKLKQLNDRESK